MKYTTDRIEETKEPFQLAALQRILQTVTQDQQMLSWTTDI